MEKQTAYEAFGLILLETYKDNQEVIDLYYTGRRIQFIRASLMNIFGKGRATLLTEYKPLHNILRYLDFLKDGGDNIACRLIPEQYALYLFYGDYKVSFDNDFRFVRQRPPTMKKVSIKEYPIGYRLTIDELLQELMELSKSLLNHRLWRNRSNKKLITNNLNKQCEKFCDIMGIPECYKELSNTLHIQNVDILRTSEINRHQKYNLCSMEVLNEDVLDIIQSFLITP